MQAEGDVDGVLIHEALQARHAGTLELRLGGTVPDVHPAHSLVGVAEVHGCGLPCAGGHDGRHLGPIQVCGQDVLRVGNQQHRGPVYRLCMEERRVNAARVPRASQAVLHPGTTLRAPFPVATGDPTHRSWPCRNGCLAVAGNLPHSRR